MLLLPCSDARYVWNVWVEQPPSGPANREPQRAIPSALLESPAFRRERMSMPGIEHDAAGCLARFKQLMGFPSLG